MAAISAASSSIEECSDPKNCSLTGVDHESYRNEGSRVCFFILGNPSKLIKNPENPTNYIRIFQCCIACGTNRFYDDDWNGKLDATIHPTSCETHECILEIMRATMKSLIPYELLYLDYLKS